MIAQIESLLIGFLRSPAKLLSAEDARRLLEHVAFCDECADSLKRQPVHAEVLLESLHAAPKWTPTEEDKVRGVQKEILVFGDAILNRLKRSDDYSQFREQLDEPLAREHKEEFSALGELEPPRLHMALGSTAIKLTVGGWLASAKESPARAELTYDGLKVNGQMVPNSLFAERVANYGVMSEPLAERTWSAGKYVAIDERLGVPGTYWIPLRPGAIGLTLSARGLEHWRNSLG